MGADPSADNTGQAVAHGRQCAIRRIVAKLPRCPVAGGYGACNPAFRDAVAVARPTIKLM